MRPVIRSPFTLFFVRVALILETEEEGAYTA